MPKIGIFVNGSGAAFGSAPFEFAINTANTSTGSTADNQFKLPLVSSLPLDAKVDWGDGTTNTITAFNQAEVTHTYPSVGTYTIKITGDLSGWAFNSAGDRLKMLNVVTWGALNVSVSGGFFGCNNLTCSATDAPLITSTSLANYFRACPFFNGNISNWNTTNVVNITEAFANTTQFNVDISTKIINAGQPNQYTAWDVSNVTSFSEIFRAAIAFNQPIGNWNVQNATRMDGMFNGATAFNQNIGSWNVSKVTNFIGFMGSKTAANYSAANLDAIYNGWSSRAVKPNLSISFGTIKFTAAGVAGKAILTGAPNNWTIVDGGL